MIAFALLLGFFLGSFFAAFILKPFKPQQHYCLECGGIRLVHICKDCGKVMGWQK